MSHWPGSSQVCSFLREMTCLVGNLHSERRHMMMMMKLVLTLPR